jgi:hypothetical protein
MVMTEHGEFTADGLCGLSIAWDVGEAIAACYTNGLATED